MNEDNYEKILKVLDEHKEHSISFRSETTSELKQIGRRLDISNGRMAKQEEATQRLREEDIGMSQELKFIKENGRFIRDRTWTILTSVISILAVSAIMWVISK
ncbi:MAG: hypothetical protein UT24_C0052G0003 [Candidatus Woesebacteria bacterium GW2011_GWB1_39_12]|uniref:Uncharacterized protein n=1 Tax=Candidatus Woesebacteria bacterium GW2011_GWB1_39_12 TaxID=1618574 RepID=A0A0G0M1J3_9BACT|nr:MAG: hypothetical protein UT24_C0052G0003 [Candidatus Woesebacteria bacterium GW2011_GWB1_39_12]